MSQADLTEMMHTPRIVWVMISTQEGYPTIGVQLVKLGPAQSSIAPEFGAVRISIRTK